MDTAKTADDLLRVGIDVRYFGDAEDPEAPGADGDGFQGPDEVQEEIFCRWASTSVFKHGDLVGRWWSRLPAGADEGDAALEEHALKALPEDTLGTLYSALREQLAGSVTVFGLAKHFCDMGAPPQGPFALPGDANSPERQQAEEDLLDAILEELAAASAYCADEVGGAVMEPQHADDCGDDAGDGPDLAHRLAYGWPSRAEEPTRPREAGRLARAFPLLFPMGIGDLYDQRPRAVGVVEHAQHLLRIPWI